MPGDSSSRKEAEIISDKMYNVYAKDKANIDQKFLGPNTLQQTAEQVGTERIKAAGVTHRL